MTVASRVLRALTYQQIFNTAADIEWGFKNTTAGLSVNEDTARKLLAVWACQRLLTNSISTMPVAVLRKQGDKRIPVADPPWLKQPTTNLNDTWVDHIADVVMSLMSEGNGFVVGTPDIRVMTEFLTVLDPSSVKIDDKAGGTTLYRHRALGDMTHLDLIHISLIRKPGSRRGLSPIDNGLDTIGVGLAAQEFGARYFANGAALSGVIETPPGTMMTPEAQKNLRESFAAKHQGVRNSHAFGVLTGGATFRPISSTPQEAQLLELRKFAIEDIARLYGIPPHMIQSQEPGAVSYASVEQRAIDYVSYAVAPLVVKIERAYQRLLRPDEYLKFNLSALLRGDQKSRYESYQVALQNKFMTIDEVRAFEDFEPYGGDAGGFLETPNNNAPDPRVGDIGALIRAGFDADASVAATGHPPIKHSGLVPVTVQGENVATDNEPNAGDF